MNIVMEIELRLLRVRFAQMMKLLDTINLSALQDKFIENAIVVEAQIKELEKYEK